MGNFPGPKKEWGAEKHPQKWAPPESVTCFLVLAPVAIAHGRTRTSESRGEDRYRAPALCIFGWGKGRGLERPAVRNLGGPLPQKRERAALRAAPILGSARLAAVLVVWSVK